MHDRWSEVAWPGAEFLLSLWGDAEMWFCGGACLDGRSGVFVSRDAGRTWVDEKRTGKQSIASLHGVPGGTVWAAGAGGAVLRRGVKDRAWKRVRTGIDATHNAVFCRGEREVYLGDNDGKIHRSGDAGATWVSTAVSSSISAIHGASEGPLFAVTSLSEVLVSESGVAWAPCALPAFTLSGSMFRGLRFARVTRFGAFVGGDQRQLLRSRDGGDTWTRIELPMLGDEVSLTAMASNATTLLVATLRQLLISTDGGDTWRIEHTTPDGRAGWFFGLWMADDGRAVAAGGSGLMLRREA